jgi:glutamate formiminotransferase/glutamate formiminotransferase/formiminotetrahydrofolate cyclodeaminase
MTPPLLLAVPNVSEGRDADAIARIGAAFVPGADTRAPGADAGSAAGSLAAGKGEAPVEVRLLDVHSDPHHHRSVFTLAGPPRALADALVRGAAEAVRSIDVVSRFSADPAERGAHPHVGAIDVVPLVYFDERARGAACAEALVVGDRIARELDVPVFLYGELAGDLPGRTRADLRRGGVAGLAARLAGGETPAGGEASAPAIRPDFGPAKLHPSAGATLVAAREPLVAFNLQLRPPATIDDARLVASLVREGGARGLPGVRAIALALGGGVVQVSMNLERPLELSLAEVVAAVAALAPVAGGELVGLAPRAALEGLSPELPLPGFDPQRHIIENALAPLVTDREPAGELADADSQNADGRNALGS